MGAKKVPNPKPSVRLYALLASEGPWGVVFRRGPSQQVQIYRWDTRNDAFEPGQWLKGRIYERMAALSPSGEKLIYISEKHQYNNPHRGSFLIVSKPPYLTALNLWKVCGCADGGGYFASESQINISFHSWALRPQNPLPEHIRVVPLAKDEQFHEHEALTLDGWMPIGKGITREYQKEKPVYRKPIETLAGYELEMRILGFVEKCGSATTTDYYLHESKTGNDSLLGRFDWANVDKSGDLLFASDGQIFRCTTNWNNGPPYEIDRARLLYDFTDSTFKAMAPTDEALQW